jgi:hypothetical protein
VEQASSIPAYLWIPLLSAVEPPVESRPQDLPLERLTWEAFERLCARLAKRETDLQFCYLYGEPGQAQEGIDLFGRKAGGARLTTWQCKRYQKFGVRELRKAAKEFVNGDWATKTDLFHICVTAPLERRPLIDEVEKQIAKLAEKGITFEPLGKAQLSERLKSHPDLVDDFFGRQWATAFCGEPAVRNLRDRLLTGDVVRLRRLLREYYSSHFAALDPGLPIAAGQIEGDPFSIDKRYILPDVYDDREIAVGKRSPVRDREISVTDEMGERDRREGASGSAMHAVAARVRVPISSWMQHRERTVLLGDAGFGKSTFLRRLAMDLLADDPVHEPWSRLWGDRLPVWVPFPMWTRMVAESEAGCSLPEAIRTWLIKVGAPDDLLRLTAEALDDDRLLLLIDGLDEWANETAAGTALTLLKTFVGTRPVAAIATGRPVAYQRLGSIGPGWRTAQLAPFTRRQQRSLAERWFIHLEEQRSGDKEAAARLAAVRAASFMTAVQREPAIAELAGTPLLLSGLIALSVYGVELPSNRFQAYAQMSELLLREQPRRRANAAMARQRGSTLSDESRERALSELAYRMTTSASPYVCDKDEAVRILATHLESSLGLGRADACQRAAGLLDETEVAYGILSEKSHRDIGFIHRVFQDFLTAKYLVRQSLEFQRDFLKTHHSSPQASEVILDLLHLNEREAEVDALVGVLREIAASRSDEYALHALLGEVAFAKVNCSPAVVHSLAESAISRISSGDWAPIRRRLIGASVGALSSDILRHRILRVMGEWFPRSKTSKRGIYYGSANWKDPSAATEMLLRGLCDEESGDRHAAAEMLANRSAGDASIYARLLRMLRTVDAGPAAAVLNALGRGWTDFDGVPKLLHYGLANRSYEIRVVAACRRVDLRQRDERDREVLLEMAHADQPDEIRYDYNTEIARALVDGWPGNEEIRRQSMAAIRNPRNLWRQHLERSIAGGILVTQPANDETATLLADIFRTEQYPEHEFGGFFSGFEFFDTLYENYARHPILTPAIHDWLEKFGRESSDTEHIAPIARSAVAKQFLLDPTRNTPFQAFWTLRGLIQGWGANDCDVIAFAENSSRTSAGAQTIASLLPSVLTDKDRCSRILLDALADPEAHRLDMVLEGLRQLGKTDRAVADLFYSHALDSKELGYYGTVGAAIRAFPMDPRSRALALSELCTEGGNITAVAEVFGDDPEIRDRLLALSQGLPADLRYGLIERLGEQAVSDDDVLSLLSTNDRDSDAGVRTAAAVSYWRARAAHGDLSGSDLDRLMADLDAAGMYKERRQAAFTSLVALDRMADAVIAKRLNAPNRAVLDDLFFSGTNLPLIRELAAKWSKASELFGERVWKTANFSETETIETLVIFADESDDLRRALLAKIRDVPATALGPNTLRFWSDHNAASRETLRQRLLDCVSKGGGSLPGRQFQYAAVDILADAFAGDAETYTGLVELADRYHKDAAAAALCIGWPESEYALQFEINWDRIDISRDAPLVLAFVTMRYGSGDLVKYISMVLGNLRGDDWGLLSDTFRPVVGRLSRDGEFRDTVFHWLDEHPTDDDVATWPGLLRRAGYVTPQLRRWCEDQLKHPTRDGLTRTGLDVNYGRIRAVRHALLDAISPFSA